MQSLLQGRTSCQTLTRIEWKVQLETTSLVGSEALEYMILRVYNNVHRKHNANYQLTTRLPFFFFTQVGRNLVLFNDSIKLVKYFIVVAFTSRKHD